MWFVEATEQRHAPNVHAITSSEVPGVMDFAMLIANGTVTTLMVYVPRRDKKSTRVSSTHETHILQGWPMRWTPGSVNIR